MASLTPEHRKAIGEGQRRNRAARDAAAQEANAADSRNRCQKCRRPRDNHKAHDSLCPICLYEDGLSRKGLIE